MLAERPRADGADPRQRASGERPRRSHRNTPRVLAAVVGMLAAGAAGALIALGVRDRHASSPAASTVTRTRTVTASSSNASTAAPWEAVLPAIARGVVEITVRETVSVQTPSGIPAQEEAIAVGTGIVLDTGGDILTSEHVVSGARHVEVMFPDGASSAAEVLGTDPSTNIAVIHVSGARRHLHPLRLGSASSLTIGQPVATVGTPFGYAGSVSTGVVSGLGREIQAPDGYTLTDAIQTDAAVNHGNSGGPLLDRQGHVVGINDQLADSGVDANVGVAFAVPISAGNLQVISELRLHGRIAHAWLGISGATIDATLAAAAGLKTASGVLVGGIVPASPAASAGLRAGTHQLALDTATVCTGGDAITGIDGHAVRSMNDLQNRLAFLKPGARITLAVVHADGTTTSVPLTLARQPASPPTPTSACSSQSD